MKLSLGNGLRIAGVPFALDASRPVSRAWCSHAHSDHCARHRHIIATPETLHLARLRWGNIAGTEIPFGETACIDGIDCTACRSGHILGAAMLLIEVDGQRALYTGDANLASGGALTAPADPVPECDILICEATFGDPRYVWPPRDELCRRLVEVVRETVAASRTPVVIAYSLGKAQEAVRILGDAGLTTRCDYWVMRHNNAYRKLGAALTGFAPLSGSGLPPGEVAVVSPPVRDATLARLVKPRTIMLTGWAVDGDHGPARNRADVLLPLSDHADFPALLELVESSRAKTVVTLHGPKTFAAELRGRGYDALHLTEREPVFHEDGRLSHRQGTLL